MAKYGNTGVTDQAKVSLKRWRDAQVLRANGHWRGAMYLAGYRIECLLKVRLMEKYTVRTLDDLEPELARRYGRPFRIMTHRIEYLFGFTDARDRLVVHGSPHEKMAFRNCNRWTSQWRYNPKDGTERACSDFFEAVETFAHYLRYNT